jgi:predicted nucleic acid-binding protein
VIYDTTYFLDLTKTERPAAFEKGVELFEAGVPRRVPAHVVFELFYGVEAAGVGEQRRVRNALMGYPVVPADDRIARLAGRLHARYRTKCFRALFGAVCASLAMSSAEAWLCIWAIAWRIRS